jgi:tRNA-Thr(GGU) m(6)t(6)A37 methyltransferase TsaA
LNDDVIIKPIGIVRSKLEHRYETHRQGVLAENEISTINLYPKNNFEQAVKDLEGFERIWVIYLFHLNKNWKPIITPPRNAEKKVGVFATRAPYRPNPIGLSCVKLEKIKGLKIYISESDLLNNTPVIDIKPYLPYSDSFPNVSTGWVKTDLKNIHKVKFTKKAEEKILKLLNDENINLKNYALVQLEFNPADTSRKRISEIQTLSNFKVKSEIFSLVYRDWRIIYSVIENKKVVMVRDIVNVNESKV